MSRRVIGGRILAGLVLSLFVGVSLHVLADDHPKSDHPKKEKPKKVEPAKDAPKGDAYPLDTCIVDGAKLDSKEGEVALDHEGRDLRFCCKECVEKFKKGPADFVKKLDEEIVKQQTAVYPLENCMVSGDKLGEEGKPLDRVYKNRLVRFCCPNCPKEFAEDPAKFMAILDKAVVDKQMADYPLATCPVSGDKLNGDMGKPIDYVHANRLIRFCCPDCIKDFRKTPGKFMAKVDEAMKNKPAAKPDEKKPEEKPEHPKKDHPGNEHPGDEHPKGEHPK